MQEGPDFVVESNRKGGPHSMKQHLPYMSGHAQKVLDTIVEKVDKRVSSFYLDAVDHAHFQREKR